MQRKRQPYFQIFHRQKKISTMLKALPMKMITFASTSTSTDSGDNDVDNADDEETNDREEDDGDDSGDGPSMIPFP
jgi:hypothetical protein